MQILKSALLLAIFSLPAAAAGTPAPAVRAASPPGISTAIQLYSRQQYTKSIDILENAVLTHPTDPRVHYCLANNYLAVGKLELSEREYRTCLKLNPDRGTRLFCQQGLAEIQRIIAGSAAGAGAQPDANLGKFAVSEQLIQAEGNDLRTRFSLEHSERIKLQNRIATVQIARINKDADDEIASIPKFIYVFARGRSRRVANPDYPPAVSRIRSEAEDKILAVKAELSKKGSYSLNEFDRQNTEVNKLNDNLKNADLSEKGEIRLMPVGSGLYVRNYVNFNADGPPPEPVLIPLRAKQAKFKGN